jgi:hypothetical protein
LFKKRQNKKLPIFLKGRAEMIKVNKLFYSIFSENWKKKANTRYKMTGKMCPKVQTNAPKYAGAVQKEGEKVAKKASEDRKEAEKDAAKRKF